MTTTITFDTLKFVEKLEKAGIPREQAKAEAEALSDVLQASAADLATKHDLETLEHRIGEKIEAANSNIIKWLAGLMIAQGAAIAALVKMVS